MRATLVLIAAAILLLPTAVAQQTRPGTFDAFWLVFFLMATLLVVVGLVLLRQFFARRTPEVPVDSAPGRNGRNGYAAAETGPESDPEAPRETLATLARRVQRAPFDATACFRLGVELLRQGREPEGIRYLERSIRLDALNLVRLLEQEDLDLVRSQPRVQRLLLQFKGEQDRRIFAGYT